MHSVAGGISLCPVSVGEATGCNFYHSIQGLFSIHALSCWHRCWGKDLVRILPFCCKAQPKQKVSSPCSDLVVMLPLGLCTCCLLCLNNSLRSFSASSPPSPLPYSLLFLLQVSDSMPLCLKRLTELPGPYSESQCFSQHVFIHLLALLFFDLTVFSGRLSLQWQPGHG